MVEQEHDKGQASCRQCGAAQMLGARFCHACGHPLGAESAGSDSRRNHPANSLGVVMTVAGAFALGAAAAAILLVGPLRQPHSLQTPPRALALRLSTARSLQSIGLPPGHPTVAMPSGHPALPGRSQIGAVVLQAEKQAEQRPDDIAVWNRYGDLALRFATFNPADYDKARLAFAHVLARDPDNRQALHGIGDVYFDLRQYQSAMAAYQRYLRQQPSDSSVLTDLGTVYLSQRNRAQAIKEYRAALTYSSDFFPARFNLAVAYLLQKDDAGARDALIKARAVAPDASARTRIDEILAQIDDNDSHARSHRTKTRTAEASRP